MSHVTTILARGNGGQDVAYLYDSAGGVDRAELTDSKYSDLLKVNGDVVCLPSNSPKWPT